MNAPLGSAAAVLMMNEESTALNTCDVCKHPLSAHDAVATRYCNATLHNALSRGCLCR